jgi:MerR family mercuric resistance operon transcriptional regulator
VGDGRDQGCFAIGELSRLTGVNIETIRYYERMALLPRPPRTQSGRRAYGPADVRTLAFIKRAREFGFCLDDIRELLSFRGAERGCTNARAIASRHLEGVRRKMRHLEDLEKILADAVARCPGDKIADCTVLEILDTGPGSR